MNPKEIGAFLKHLRNEKGITQEQLAEILGVSGRTVSRWETGNNLPDLSILVQISEYYDVEIKDILNGERKSENMDSELKETLQKVADYNELEKQKDARIGAVSFGIMFVVCAMSIVIQMTITGNLSLVMGETAILIVSGVIYIFFMVRNGVWNGAQRRNVSKRDFVISILCTGIFSVIFYLILKKSMDSFHAVGAAICFFIAISVVSYALLKGLSYLSEKRSDKLNDR